ncbi:YqzL family protein [Proteiniborus ethanoligenes]|nr:YqzL family protein [Proteiniborus ethanoligenes]
MFNAEFFWKMFELTGSVNAYLIYKKLIMNCQINI